MSPLLWWIAGGLLLLAAGLALRNDALTAVALGAIVAIALFAIPALVRAVHLHDDITVSAILGIDATAAIAFTTLVLWRLSRRYPTFNAIAALAVGLAAAALVAQM